MANTGSKRTDETRKKMSDSHTCENNAMWGKKHTTDSKKKMSDSRKGENNPNFGKTLSDQTKQKISKSKSGISSKLKGIPRKQIKCPQCDKVGGDGLMQRWHFNNCKFKKNE